MEKWIGRPSHSKHDAHIGFPTSPEVNYRQSYTVFGALLICFIVVAVPLNNCCEIIVGTVTSGYEDYYTMLRRETQGLPVEWIFGLDGESLAHAWLRSRWPTFHFRTSHRDADVLCLQGHRQNCSERLLTWHFPFSHTASGV